MDVKLWQWITENLGAWWADYPYSFGALEIIIILVALIFLQNMLYILTRFISGDRR